MSEELDIPVTTEVADTAELWPIRSRGLLGAGKLFSYRSDQVAAPDGSTMTRDWLDHCGAVGVIAVDDQQRVVVVNQYRHAAGQRLVEPPAGLLDIAGEDWQLAAERELAEEAGLRAEDWRVLVDVVTTPGSVSETVRIFLARGLHAAPRPEGFELVGEEADMTLSLVPLETLVEGILAGRLQNPLLVSGCLALWASRDDLDRLRPGNAPWPARDAVEALREASEDSGEPDRD